MLLALYPCIFLPSTMHFNFIISYPRITLENQEAVSSGWYRTSRNWNVLPYVQQTLLEWNGEIHLNALQFKQKRNSHYNKCQTGVFTRWMYEVEKWWPNRSHAAFCHFPLFSDTFLLCIYSIVFSLIFVLVRKLSSELWVLIFCMCFAHLHSLCMPNRQVLEPTNTYIHYNLLIIVLVFTLLIKIYIRFSHWSTWNRFLLISENKASCQK